jgi:hypothetical protein
MELKDAPDGFPLDTVVDEPLYLPSRARRMCDRQSTRLKPERSSMSTKRKNKIASNGGAELTPAGVPWSEVPQFARTHVAWI